MIDRILSLVVVATMIGCGTPNAAAPEKSAASPAVTPPPAKVAPPTVAAASQPEPKPEPKPQPEPEPPPEPEPVTDEAPALDIEYVPTPGNVVKKMLEVATITKSDVVYDLGCGDGRLVIAAAKQYGARGIGFDLDPERIAEAKANVEKAGVGHLVTIEQKNIFEVDLSPASVVTLYLLPSINVRLIPQLQKLAAGSRIISHDFDMQGVDPDDVWTLVAKHHRPPPATRKHYVYKWTAPIVVSPADE